MDLKITEALRGYNATKAVKPSGDDSSTGNTLGRAAQDFTETLTRAETVAQQAMTGQADPHALVEALTNSQLAVETAVTVRDKVVEAYQEILRMPV
ncbi:MAG: flagellar hook-basal body complex protein FliE [Silicimonas sp.]|nr:flagellar hook-basal body complex protein FliE [Silicimonas sp.]